MRLLPVGSNLIFNDPSVTQSVQDLNVLDLFHYECHNNNHTLRYAILANTLSYIINVLHLSIMNYALSIMNYELCIKHYELCIKHYELCIPLIISSMIRPARVKPKMAVM